MVTLSNTGEKAMEAENERKTVTVDEAAKILGVSRAHAYEAVNSGQLRGIRLGKRWLIARATIDKMLEAK
jgi:excisionase family DNA binding protein